MADGSSVWCFGFVPQYPTVYFLQGHEIPNGAIVITSQVMLSLEQCYTMRDEITKVIDEMEVVGSTKIGNLGI